MGLRAAYQMMCGLSEEAKHSMLIYAREQSKLKKKGFHDPEVQRELNKRGASKGGKALMSSPAGVETRRKGTMVAVKNKQANSTFGTLKHEVHGIVSANTSTFKQQFGLCPSHTKAVMEGKRKQHLGWYLHA